MIYFTFCLTYLNTLNRIFKVSQIWCAFNIQSTSHLRLANFKCSVGTVMCSSCLRKPRPRLLLLVTSASQVCTSTESCAMLGNERVKTSTSVAQAPHLSRVSCGAVKGGLGSSPSSDLLLGRNLDKYHASTFFFFFFNESMYCRFNKILL